MLTTKCGGRIISLRDGKEKKIIFSESDTPAELRRLADGMESGKMELRRRVSTMTITVDGLKTKRIEICYTEKDNQ